MKRTDTYHICDRCGLTVMEKRGENHGIGRAEIFGVQEGTIQFDLCMGCRNEFYLTVKNFVNNQPQKDIRNAP